MTQDEWTAVDSYLSDRLLRPDPALDNALRTSEAAGLPAISVSPTQGKLLYLLAQLQGARNILELGTLGGYSTIWLARALPPGGRVVTLELEPDNAQVARENFAFAGLSEAIDLRVGPALESLPQIVSEGLSPFDLIFIDADKENTLPYYEWALKLARPGSLILVDNVVREGAIVDAKSTDPKVQGVRHFIDQLADDPRVTATVIQTVGGKGYDGFAFARVTDAI